MRYQQKQQQEKDQKRSEYSGGGRSLAAIDINDNKLLTASLGAGKVCSYAFFKNNFFFQLKI